MRFFSVLRYVKLRRKISVKFPTNRRRRSSSHSTELVVRLFAQRAAVVQIIVQETDGLEADLAAVLAARQPQDVAAQVATGGGGQALAVVVVVAAAATIAREAFVARVSVFPGGAAAGVATRETAAAAVAQATAFRWFWG